MRKNDCEDENEYKLLRQLEREYDDFLLELIAKHELNNKIYAKFLINTILCDFDKMKISVFVFNSILDAAKDDYKEHQDKKFLQG